MKIGLALITSMMPYMIRASAETKAITATDCNIILSNISATGATSTCPGTNTTKSIIGKSISPGYAMIKLTDLQYLGATTQQSGNYWYITINGQTIAFQRNSQNYSSSTSYTITQPSGGTQSYTYSVNGSTESGAEAQIISNVPYVRLTAAAHQCGALMVNYSSTDNAVYVYHFRVSGNTSAHTDENTYIVGGSWLTNWSTKGTNQLAPHFKVNELWDDSSSVTGTYYKQLKISLASLQSEENTRYYHNSNSSMNVTSGFRSWAGNWGSGSTSMGDKRSLHMRGRAIDATSSTTQTLYNNLYNEFRGSYSTPINGGTYSWYSRVYGTSASLSGAYDLEKMPQDSSWWIHLGVMPAYSSSC